MTNTSNQRSPDVEVIPCNISYPSYKVSRTRAEQMVARGSAKWLNGLKVLQEIGLVARGEIREWRKTICFDPDTGASMPTMQLVSPDDCRSFGSRHSSRNNRSNRKRMHSDPKPAYESTR